MESLPADAGGRAAARATRADLLPAAVIIGAGAVVAVLVGIRGDFPLSDDWSYAYTVRSLCERDRFELLAWSGASLVLQAWVGAALCKLFGFSFAILRSATVATAVAGAVGFYALAREYRRERALLALATAAFALDPLYVNLAFTFMTDVPFLALTVWASLYYVRGLARADLRRLVIGSAFCAAGVLVRQPAIFVAGAAGFTALVAAPGGRTARLGTAAAAILLPLATFAAYHVWLFAIHGATPAVAIRMAQQSTLDLIALMNVGYRSLAYLGLLTLPLALVAGAESWRRTPVVTATAGILVVATAGFLYAREHALMFYLGNTLYDFGVGALTLRDTLFLGLDAPLNGGPGFRLALTVAALAGATILLAAAVDAAAHVRDATRVFALAAFLLTLGGGALTQSQLYLDRHAIAALPFAFVLLLPLPTAHRPGWTAWLAAVGLGWWAVAGTHDYLAWNRARFALLAELEARGSAPQQIDGGFEYNGWRLAAQLGTWPSMAEARIGQPPERRSWWWVVDDRFVVSFRPLDGYRVHDHKEYRRWLVPGRGRIFLLERVANDRPQRETQETTSSRVEPGADTRREATKEAV